MKSSAVYLGIAISLWSCGISAQDPVKAFPKNYSLVLDNKAVAVIRVHYGPHEKVGVHDHSNYPTIYVYLSDSGPVRFQHYEEKPFTLDRPPAVKGSFRVSPGRPERHTVENLGDIPTDFLRVELKQVPLKLMSPFRGHAPASLSQDLSNVEFKDGYVQIQRIICVEPEACPVKASAAPSLIVALTPLQLTEGSKSAEKLEDGAVRWIPTRPRTFCGLLSLRRRNNGQAILDCLKCARR
jgi:hypothetical protein